jgi:hypothetical protein
MSIYRLFPLFVFTVLLSFFSVAQTTGELHYYGGDSLKGFDLQSCLRESILFRSAHQLTDAETRSWIHQKEKAFIEQKFGKKPSAPPSSSRLAMPGILTGPCNNVGFESGDYTGWTGAIGYNKNSNAPLTLTATGIRTLGINSAETSCSYHTLLGPLAGTDKYSGLSAVDAGGGLWALRMGGENINLNLPGLCAVSDPNTGEVYSNGEILQQTFPVTSSNALFNFNFAMVIAQSLHNIGENAYFRAEVLDNTGTPIPYLTQYYPETSGGVLPPGFFNSTAIGSNYQAYYTPWTNCSFNLSAFIGTNVTVRFTASGCTFGGHFAYVYLDCYCSPVQILSSSQRICQGGSATLTAPGTGIYGAKYQWQRLPSGTAGIVGADTNQVAVINAAGSYRVTVTPVGAGSNPYTIDTTLISSVAVSPQVTLTHTFPSCFPGRDATALASVTGGTAPFTYTWSPFPGGGQGTNQATGLATGTYILSFSASNGCGNTATVLIPAATAITSQVHVTPSACDSSNGTALVTPAGGRGTYSYSWNTAPVQTTALAKNLAAGNYAVTIHDSTGCSERDTVTIINPGAPVLTVAGNTSPQCFGTCSGTAAVSASGGTAPYNYIWLNTGYTTAVASNLCANTYTCQVKDAKGCISRTTITISQPTSLVCKLSTTGNKCYTGTSGTASVAATGGTGPYHYSWSPVYSTAVALTNLASGTYTCATTDSTGCLNTTTCVVDSPNPFTAHVSAFNASCGVSNGSASVSVTGGIGNLSYSWSPSGGNSVTATSLSADTYTITVTDSSGCSTKAAVSVNNNGGPALSSNSSAPKCYGGCNGTATVTATGGAGPYSYSWSPVGGTAAQAINLCPGTYYCQVKDSTNCATNVSVSVLSVPPQGPTIVDSIASCGRCDGISTVYPPINYSGAQPFTYLWSPGGATGAKANHLCPGTYTCTMTDANGCQYSAITTITQKPSMGLKLTSSSAMCATYCNGIISASATGGSASYVYSWNPSGTGSFASGLCPGTYVCTVTDGASCQAIGSVVLDSSSRFNIQSANVMSPSCYGTSDGSVSIAVSGGYSPYTYSWSPGSGSTSIEQQLGAGTYSCVVRDGYGCISKGITTVYQPAPITLQFTNSPASCSTCTDGKAQVSATGGNFNYTYSWSVSGSTHDTISHLAPGIYTCCVTDWKGCSNCQTDTIPIRSTAGIETFNPDTRLRIFPNPFQDVIELALSGAYSKGQLTISNLLGQTLFSHQLNTGTLQINTADLPSGVYLLSFQCDQGRLVRKMIKE